MKTGGQAREQPWVLQVCGEGDEAAHAVAEEEEGDTGVLALLPLALGHQWPGVLLHGGRLGPGSRAPPVANVVVPKAQQTQGTTGATKLKRIWRMSTMSLVRRLPTPS